MDFWPHQFSCFLCQGKLITFSIIQSVWESLQLLSRVLPQAIMLLSAFWSVCLSPCSLFSLVHYVSDHIFMYFYGKGMLRHAIKEVWRIFSICSLIFLNPHGLMILFLFVIIPSKIHTFFCLLKFLSKLFIRKDSHSLSPRFSSDASPLFWDTSVSRQ